MIHLKRLMVGSTVVLLPIIMIALMSMYPQVGLPILVFGLLTGASYLFGMVMESWDD